VEFISFCGILRLFAQDALKQNHFRGRVRSAQPAVPVNGPEARAEGDITMRHRNAGFKLGRNPSHRRAVLRNLVTSIILNDRIETTVTKCKASQPLVEKMITLGKKGTVHTRRQAAAYLMTPDAVEMAYIELIGAEQELDEKRQKRAEVRAKKREELAKQLEEQNAAAGEGEGGSGEEAA
jgi:large subunit ribosomal protein L17